LIEVKMALIKCDECKKEISSKAEKCPHCGNPVRSESKVVKKVATSGVRIVFMLVFIFSIITGLFTGNVFLYVVAGVSILISLFLR
jgi:hypothetical protein